MAAKKSARGGSASPQLARPDAAGQQRADVRALDRQRRDRRRVPRVAGRRGARRRAVGRRRRPRTAARPGSRATRLRRSASSSEPSSVVRMTDCSSDIGFSSATTSSRQAEPARDRAAPVKLQPTASDRPAPTSASSARRRTRCSGASRPTAPRREGSVDGKRSSPQSRATSSIRSASRVTSSRRQCGTVTSSPSSASATPKPERRRGSARRPRAGPARRAAAPCARRAAAASTGAGPGPADVDRPADGPRAAQLDHQLRRDRLPLERLLGREPLLEPARRLGAQRRAASRCAGCSARSRSPPPSARASCRRGPRSARRPSRRRSRSGRRRRRSRPCRRRACARRRRASSSSRRRRARRTTSVPPATRSASNACSGWPVSSIT